MQPGHTHLNHVVNDVFESGQASSAAMGTAEPLTDEESRLRMSELSMRAPTSSEELLEKTSTFSWSEIASLSKAVQSQTNAYKEMSLHQDSQQLSDYSFSVNYWHDIDGITDQEKENKIQTFLIACLNEFNEEMGEETQQSFSPEGDFTQYLFSMKNEDGFSSLMKECAQYYALLSKAKNNALKERMLVYFPPKAEDLACIPGTRSRLQEAIQAFKRAEGLLNPIDDLIQQGVQRQFNKIYIDYKISNHVYAGNEVHLQPFFHHILGVSEEVIKEKDQFFSLPQYEVTAESVYDFISTLSFTVEKTIKDLIKEEIIDFSRNISNVEKLGFLSGLLDDLENGSFVQLIKSMNDSFILSGINYKEPVLDENGDETERYQWNQSDLYADIFHALSAIENRENKKNVYFDYKDAFSHRKQREIYEFLKSSNVEEFESAVNLLFTLSNPYKGSSPIEFLNILLRNAIDERSLNEIDIALFMLDLKMKCDKKEEFHHLLEKVYHIEKAMFFYLNEENININPSRNYILFLERKINIDVFDDLIQLMHSLIFCNASVDTFRLLVGNNINLIRFKDISNLIAYSQNRKELLEYFKESITEEGIICLFEKAIDIKDDMMICEIFNCIDFSRYSLIDSGDSQILLKLFKFCVQYGHFELAENYLIHPINAIDFLNNSSLFNLVKYSASISEIRILNFIVNYVPKEIFFGLENNKWVSLILSFIEIGEKKSLEIFSNSYFDSGIKEMLFNIKDSEEIEDIEVMSDAIKKSCLEHSTIILDILIQSGCTIDDILYLSSQGDHSPFIDHLFSNNIYNYYSMVSQEGRDNIIKKRDDTVMWLIEHGCTLYHFQEKSDENGFSFIYHCAKKLEFNLLSKMLHKTESYSYFMALPTEKSEHLLFMASKACSKAKGELRDFLLHFIMTALDHPTRNQTLNQPHYSRGLTPLHYAMSRGCIDLLTILLEDQYLTIEDIEAKSTGEYSGHSAMKLAKVAIEKGAQNSEDIQTCIDMLENKIKSLLSHVSSTENIRKRPFGAI